MTCKVKLELEFFLKTYTNLVLRQCVVGGGVSRFFFFFFCHFLFFIGVLKLKSKFSQPHALSNKTVTEAKLFLLLFFFFLGCFFSFFILSRILVSKNKMIWDTRYTDRLGATFTTAWDHFFLRAEITDKLSSVQLTRKEWQGGIFAFFFFF